MSISYKQAGVDIDAGNRLVNNIKPFVKATARLGANPELGGFGALFDLAKCNFRDPILVSSTDGVGTKLKIAIEANFHDNIGIDLVAMSVNDLIVQGAEPLFFLDYFACSKLENSIAEAVISSIAKGCKIANCALIGGETAEMPGLYQGKDYDLAGFAVGAVERDSILPKQAPDVNAPKSGDALIGLASSGIHSNGFSLARLILNQNNISLESSFLGSPLYQNLLIPTKIYVEPCLKLAKANKIKAMAHITGGGIIENLPRILAKDQKFSIDYSSWQRPEIFQYLQNLGNVAESEMLRTFNCGIGMILVVDKNIANEIYKQLLLEKHEAFIIGEII